MRYFGCFAFHLILFVSDRDPLNKMECDSGLQGPGIRLVSWG
jgi:hypothetical protein